MVYITNLLSYVWLRDRSSQSRRNICFVSLCKTLLIYCVIFIFPLRVFKWTFTFEMLFTASWTDLFKLRQYTRCLGGPTSKPSDNVVCLLAFVWRQARILKTLNTLKREFGFLDVPNPPLCLVWFKISRKPAKLYESWKLILDRQYKI